MDHQLAYVVSLWNKAQFSHYSSQISYIYRTSNLEISSMPFEALLCEKYGSTSTMSVHATGDAYDCWLDDTIFSNVNKKEFNSLASP